MNYHEDTFLENTNMYLYQDGEGVLHLRVGPELHAVGIRVQLEVLRKVDRNAQIWKYKYKIHKRGKYKYKIHKYGKYKYKIHSPGRQGWENR